MGRAGRLHGLDVARGLAVLGMVLVNVKVSLGADTRGPELLTLLATPLTGRAAATFVVLAGIGVSLMSGRARHSGDRAARRAIQATMLRRCAFLLVLGLGLLGSGWIADILHFYAFYLAIAAGLMFVPGWGLAAAGVVAVVGFYGALPGYERGWDWSTLAYADLWTPLGFAHNLLFNGFHPVFPWVAFVLYGMALGRLDLGDRRVARRLVVGGLAVTALATALSAGLTARVGAEAELAVLVSTQPMPPGVLYLLAGGGTATALIGACLLATTRWPDAFAWRALRPLGLHALTHYVAHVLLLIVPLAVAGLDQTGDMRAVWGASLAYGVVGMAFSAGWQRRFGRGPLAALMRRVTG